MLDSGDHGLDTVHVIVVYHNLVLRIATHYSTEPLLKIVVTARHGKVLIVKLAVLNTAGYLRLFPGIEKKPTRWFIA